MKNNIQRNTTIISELINYFTNLGSSHINIDYNNTNDETHIIVNITIDNLSTETLDNISTYLNIPRRQDIEEYYWELNGNDNNDSELTLVGMMIDSVRISYKNNNLKLDMLRS